MRKGGRSTAGTILDEPIYLKPALTELPGDIQTRWQRHAFSYKRNHDVDYPPFAEFSKFIQDVSLENNDPNLVFERPENDNPPARMCDRSLCPLASAVPFVPCKPIDERKSLIRQHRLCFRCLTSTTHMAKECKLPVKCTECESDKHLAALHVKRKSKPKDPEEVQGGEQRNG
ncbi:Hypothetical predicted protein [Paramuricea clavata]|uniref:Uncharacterized protein n=1 Tax=Paramuricea clavata TaxID=317549 RepID=A0A7D9EYX4_PARCT|nr:Hypothetical predicted protein [Paramuricea clavata]